MRVVTFGLGGTPSELVTFGFGSASVFSPSQIAAQVWDTVIEGGFTARDLLRIIAAAAAGKTIIIDHGNHTATVTFRSIDDTHNTIIGEMTGSERTDVTLDP